MNNKDYASLLDDTTQTPDGRMGHITKIIQKEVQETIVRLEKDPTLFGKIPLGTLKELANNKFRQMKTGLEQDYKLYLLAIEGTSDNPTPLKILINYSKRGRLEQMFRGTATPQEFNYYNDITRRINESAHIGTGDTITTGTIDVGRFNTNELNTAAIRSLDAEGLRTIVGRASDSPRVIMEAGATRFIQRPDSVATLMNNGTPVMDLTPLRTDHPAVLAEGPFMDDVQIQNARITPFTPDNIGTGEVHASHIEMDDLRAATWDARSTTDDMRELNQRRVIADIQAGIRRIADEYRGPFGLLTTTENQLLVETRAFLSEREEQGIIEGYAFNSFRTEPSALGAPNIRMQLAIRPIQSTEWINMSVNLVP